MITIETIPVPLQSFLSFGDAVIITDVNHTILDVNEAFELVTGYKRQEIIGLRAGFFKSHLTPNSTLIDLKETIKQERHWSGVLINTKKNGDLWHSSITISPFHHDNTLFYVGIFKELEQLNHGIYLSETKKETVHQELLKVLAISCEIRDPGIDEHLLKVSDLTKHLLHAHIQKHDMDLDEVFINAIVYSSILHDIGKAGVPEGILYKPGKLTSYERKIIEMHPLMGRDIIRKISTEMNTEFLKSLSVAENIITYHHENWDGTGYPYQLKGEKIPFEARIVSIVDVFEALTSRRSYKDPWSERKALQYIHEMKGKKFDPSITTTFLELF